MRIFLVIAFMLITVSAVAVVDKKIIRPQQSITERAVSDQGGPALSDSQKTALSEKLIDLEKQSWEAWKNRDGKFFQNFLTEDHVEAGVGGFTNKAQVVAGVASPICVVKTYAVSAFKVTFFDATTAVVNYRAEQDTTCNGVAVPSPAWTSSMYVKRGDHWLNALYQQTPIPHK